MSVNHYFRNKATQIAKKLNALPVYQHPADLLNTPIKPMAEQYLQIQGKLLFGAQKYTSVHHQRLMTYVRNTKANYRNESQIEIRKSIAKSQYLSWKRYNLELANNLAINDKINEQQKHNIYQAFLIAKERNQERLALNRLIKLTNAYTKAFKFDFPIHPLVLLRMVHPHFGYFNFYQNKLTLDQVYQLFNDMIALSKLRYQGFSLHSSQLLAFNFWSLYNPSNIKGYMEMSQFYEFLKLFKFDVNNLQKFNHQFNYSLNKSEGEFLKGKDNIVRFDFFRQLFLDHDL